MQTEPGLVPPHGPNWCWNSSSAHSSAPQSTHAASVVVLSKGAGRYCVALHVGCAWHAVVDELASGWNVPMVHGTQAHESSVWFE